MLVDEALQKLGFIGRWQVLWFTFLVLSCVFPGAWHVVSIVWIGYKPSHHCRLPDNTSVLEEWIPRQDNSKLSFCTMYVNLSVSNETMNCPNGWVYDESISGPTIVSKWDMVCDKAYLVDTAQSVMNFGVMLGSLVFTKLSDTFGRKYILIIVQLSLSAMGALSVLPSNLYLYYFLRFLIGAFQQGLVLCHIVAVCEMFSSKDRPLVAIGSGVCWGFGNSILPLIAYLTKNWVTFELVISLYGFLFIPIFWKLPRSVPWLYTNNRLQEAEEVIKKAAKMNKIVLTQPILDVNLKTNCSLESLNSFEKNGIFYKIKKLLWKRSSTKKEKSSTAAQYSVLDLFRNKILLKHLLVGMAFGFVVNLVYFALTLSSNLLSGNHYLNGFFMSFLEVPACIITMIFVNRYGRKAPLAAMQAMAGVALLSIVIVRSTVAFGSTKDVVITVLSVAGKFFITGAAVIQFFFVTELFPTGLRNQGVGICDFIAKCGTILASYSPFLMEKYPFLPPALFGSISIIVAFLVVFVPETHNRALPETIDEIELWSVKPPLQREDIIIDEKTAF